jgi:immunoglobulin-like protein involved in spore germination
LRDFVSMNKRCLALLLLIAVAAGCGGGSKPSTTTVPTTTAIAKMMPLTVFRIADGALRAETVQVPETQAVASAALTALGIDARVTIDAGTARVDLADATAERVAEIVYTLTQFPTVHRVDVAGRSALTRTDVSSFEPVIFIERPAAGSTVPESFTVSGTASVFEATLVVELRQGGTVVSKQTVTASEGAPARGTFTLTMQAPEAGPATVVAYSPSAADGTPQHEQQVKVTVMP